MQDFRRLSAWRKAHAGTLLVYHATRKFPDEERYGLKAQLRRAAAWWPTEEDQEENGGRESRPPFENRRLAALRYS